MADKTTTKAPKAAVKKTVALEKSLEEQLMDKRSDLMDARKSLAAGELVNPRVIGRLRKDIARTMTKLNAEKEAK